jgi:hypothetical protein
VNVFAVSLPMPPSANNMFATDFKTKRRFITRDYAEWKKAAAFVLSNGWKAQGQPSFTAHLALTIHLGLNYRGDISGRVKAIEDLLVQTIPGFPDDRWIDRIEIERVPGISGARILVQQATKPADDARPIGEIIKPVVAAFIAKAVVK